MKTKKRAEIQEMVADLSCGLLAGVTDIFLFCLFQSVNVGKYGGRTSYAVDRSIKDSIDEVVSLGIDKESVKKAFWNLTHQKLIKKKRQKNIEITREGIKKLSQLIPSYREKRLWNGHFYLVIYDINEKQRRTRRILREYLKKLGCGLLQDSVWLTPYNPKNILREFLGENNISGDVIVSDIGKDGSIGDESLEDLIVRVFRLEEINRRYEDFMGKLTKNIWAKNEAHFHFLAILQDDPQLPFEILPSYWKGDDAYQLLKKKLL